MDVVEGGQRDAGVVVVQRGTEGTWRGGALAPRHHPRLSLQYVQHLVAALCTAHAGATRPQYSQHSPALPRTTRSPLVPNGLSLHAPSWQLQGRECPIQGTPKLPEEAGGSQGQGRRCCRPSCESRRCSSRRAQVGHHRARYEPLLVEDGDGELELGLYWQVRGSGLRTSSPSLERRTASSSIPACHRS